MIIKPPQCQSNIMSDALKSISSLLRSIITQCSSHTPLRNEDGPTSGIPNKPVLGRVSLQPITPTATAATTTPR